MKFGDTEIRLLSDGSFTLDPGAAFGIVPHQFWSKRFSTTEAGRVTLALRIPYITGKDFSAIIDTGIGATPDEKLKKIFEMKKGEDLISQLLEVGNPEEIDMTVHSHLHFDHFGHSLERNRGKWALGRAKVVAQKSEFSAARKTNEFTRNNYGKLDLGLLSRVKKVQLDGTTRLKHGFTAIHTGGHTIGHQAIVYSNGGKEMIYFGDLIPTTFHLKLPYVTAIDTFPLSTVEMKRKLISRAIRNKSVCVFNHDTEMPAAVISGTVEDPKAEAVEL